MSNRTVLVDNNTWNNTHIATVGKAMASNEKDAWDILESLDADYVFVIFGGLIGYPSDDVNKFLWMVRIGGGVFPEIRESDFLDKNGHYRVDASMPDALRNSLVYKLSYYRFAEMPTGQKGYDRVRNTVIGDPDFKLEYFEEVLTTSHWMVRVYVLAACAAAGSMARWLPRSRVMTLSLDHASLSIALWPGTRGRRPPTLTLAWRTQQRRKGFDRSNQVPVKKFIMDGVRDLLSDAQAFAEDNKVATGVIAGATVAAVWTLYTKKRSSKPGTFDIGSGSVDRAMVETEVRFACEFHTVRRVAGRRTELCASISDWLPFC